MEETLEKARKELGDILSKIHSEDDLTLGWDRAHRWKERTKKIIELNISKEEAEKFEKAGPVSFSMMDIFGNFHDYIKHHDSHLQALIEDVKNNPEFYKFSSKKIVNEVAPIQNLFSSLHPIIYQKCKKLYMDSSYSESVELGFKIVKDKLRELTSYENGSEAFGKGKLHIKGAATMNVDSDFNNGVKFLTMAIDMFRNEKVHTSDANITDSTRAYEYLRLSSLALNLLDNSEIIKV